MHTSNRVATFTLRTRGELGSRELSIELTGKPVEAPMVRHFLEQIERELLGPRADAAAASPTLAT